MKRFTCPTCAKEVHFRNQSCVNCGTRLGFDANAMTMQAVGPDVVLCANAPDAGCNWLAVVATPGSFCLACQHNHIVPDASMAGNTLRWREVELAKRKLIYGLIRWNLPRPTRLQDPNLGLAFDFLADRQGPNGVTPVMTGHQSGLITINIAESDDDVRVARRTAMDEPYRTLIGHMRHEVGHFYWAMLVEGSPQIDRYRELFGDERADYATALQRHYDNGAPVGWQQSHISAYATSHPWEDFAETWAHWMHIADGIETAAAYEMALDGRQVTEDAYTATEVQPVIEAWVPVTVALNNMNRAMGQPDLYPFVLNKPVMAKLQFINDLIHAAKVA
ncbi:zinc-binding metallopeptidase family protein [Loktanella sp. DJP18]|uniref:zinc-binding metallopeptidase family protein n=1 Tax=Loktanella sp. DJP18 TaxID=3409788 RepID=UPI003BB52103